jgi:TrmH family RNA methyltransferase
MISSRKLAALPRNQRIRKILKMFGEAEARFLNAGKWDYPMSDFASALEILALDAEFPPETAPFIVEIIAEARDNLKKPDDGASLRRRINAIRHILMEEIGKSPSDWDFLDAEHKLDAGKRRIFKGMTVYLEDIRSPFNVGSMFRVAESFGVEKIFLSPLAANPRHTRAQRTAMGCVDVVGWERAPLEICAGKTVFALETGGVPLKTFPFPESGVMIAGSEELGVSPQGLAIADASLGRVSIPTFGAKGSLNVSAAFAIVTQAWADFLSFL